MPMPFCWSTGWRRVGVVTLAQRVGEQFHAFSQDERGELQNSVEGVIGGDRVRDGGSDE